MKEITLTNEELSIIRDGDYVIKNGIICCILK